MSNHASTLINFNDVRVAFKDRPSSELLHSLMVLEACKYKPFVANADDIMNTMTKLFGPGLTGWTVKKTFFGHFCAGNDPCFMFCCGDVSVGSIIATVIVLN